LAVLTKVVAGRAISVESHGCLAVRTVATPAIKPIPCSWNGHFGLLSLWTAIRNLGFIAQSGNAPELAGMQACVNAALRPQCDRRVRRHFVISQLDAPSLRERREDDYAFHPGEAFADADARPGAKRKVRQLRPRCLELRRKSQRIEAIGFRPPSRVAMR